MQDAPAPDSPSSAPRPPRLVGQLRDSAERLASLAEAFGQASLAVVIRDDARRRLDDGRVRAVVLGEIKHGKSSLINALLGEPALPIGVTPTTGAVISIRAASGKDREFLGPQLVDEAGARKPLTAEAFEPLAKGKQPVADGGVLEVVVKAGRLPQTLELIDTPGFNDIAKFRAALSRSELPRADVLVVVLDATQVLSRSELELLRDAIAALGGIQADRRSGARCLLVINRIDLVPEPERPKIVAHLRAELANVLPGDLEPFSTDSKTALREPQTDRPEVRAVAELREELFSLAGDSRSILPARARTAMLRQAKLLAYNATIQARALHLERSEISEEIDRVEQAMRGSERDLAKLRADIPAASARVVVACGERLTKFRADLEEAARAQIHKADIQTLTQVVPGAIQDAFLDFVGQERDRVQAELEQLTRDVLATHGELAQRRLVEATLPLGFRGPGLYVEPPTVLIEVGTLALGLAGTIIWYFGSTMTGMIMTIASPLTTVILREKTIRDAREQARAALPEALDGAIEQLRQATADVAAEHARALDEHLVLADHALAEQLTAALRRAELRLGEHEARLTALAAAAKPAPAESTEPAEPDDAQPSTETSTATAKNPAAKAESATPLADEAAVQRLRDRVAVAAQTELHRLEDRLDELVAELVDLDLETDAEAGRPEPDEPPPVLH